MTLGKMAAVPALLAGAALALGLAGWSSAGTSDSHHDAGYHLAALTVADLDSSVIWYGSLGFVERNRMTVRDGRSHVVLMERPGLILELTHHEDQVAVADLVDPAPRRFLILGIFKFGMPFAAFDSLVEAMDIGEQVFLDPTFNVRSVLLTDPSGIAVQIFQPG